jgi:hypothetical protein
MDINEIKPTALLAGLAVLGGVMLFASKKKKQCTELPGIYDEESPLHITEEYHAQAYQAAKMRIRDNLLTKQGPSSLTDTKLHVAKQLRQCDWEKLTTFQQKAVWNAISVIVEEVNALAIADPEAFQLSF